MKLTAALVSPVVLSASLLAPAAADPARAAQYFGARDKERLASVTPEDLQMRGRERANAVVELKGVVLGSMKRNGGSTLMLRSNEGEYMVEVGSQFPASLSETGQNVRVLCRVVPIANSQQAELHGIALVEEHEAMQLEVERQRKAQERAALEARRGAARQRMASRGRVDVSRQPAPQQAWSQLEVVHAYTRAVRYFNKRISDQEAQRIARNIIHYSNRYGLDPRLVMAVIAVESNFNAEAVSRAGAMGLGQLMPGTAAGLGVGNAFNHEENLEGSTRLLSGHIANMSRKHGGPITLKDVQLALACYNAGAGAVKRHGGIPPYRETQNYVTKITKLYYQLCGVEPPR